MCHLTLVIVAVCVFYNAVLLVCNFKIGGMLKLGSCVWV